MRYTASALAAASRPVVLTIGRASDRRGLRRLSRWWVRRFRTWEAKPLSVPQMLTLQASREPVAYVVALAVVLRAVLPRRWWYRVTGDPVALILQLGTPVAAGGYGQPEIMAKVLSALVTVPGDPADKSKDTDDPYAALRRAQREHVYGKQQAAAGVSLAHAALVVRAAYGDAWYWNPARWATSDGYAPFALAYLEYLGLDALTARETLAIAHGTTLPQARNASRELEKLRKQAYPVEVS